MVTAEQVQDMAVKYEVTFNEDDQLVLTGDRMPQTDESLLNAAGLVVMSRRIVTVGEAPMETAWQYTICSTRSV